MNRVSYGDFIMNKIAEVQYGQPFQTDRIAEAMAEEYRIPVRKAQPLTNVAMKRFADRGLIERYQKGIYYRAKQTVFGKARPSKDILEAEILRRRGDEIIGYETGASLMNKMGLTSLVPKKLEIATNAYRKNMDARNIVARKPVTTVNADNFRYLQLLDAIRILPETSVDEKNPKALFRNFIKKNDLDVVEILRYAKRYYPQKTLLNLIDVLVER